MTSATALCPWQRGDTVGEPRLAPDRRPEGELGRRPPWGCSAQRSRWELHHPFVLLVPCPYPRLAPQAGEFAYRLSVRAGFLPGHGLSGSPVHPTALNKRRPPVRVAPRTACTLAIPTAPPLTGTRHSRSCIQAEPGAVHTAQCSSSAAMFFYAGHDAILNGLPPHIAQVIAGHGSINTTMGDAAIYPADAIEAHQALMAPSRTPACRGIQGRHAGRVAGVPWTLRAPQARPWGMRSSLWH